MTTERIAIIGTAGRDKIMPMTKALWHWMVADAEQRTPVGCHLVSGGAAWADHVAVALFLKGHAAQLTLHIPAPFIGGRYVGPIRSAGQASNYYHQMFSRVAEIDTLAQIEQASMRVGISGSFEPVGEGYGAMFARNLKVATAARMLAYTFGSGEEPLDGGTKFTWDACHGAKTHVTLPRKL